MTIVPEEETLPKKLILPAPCQWKTLYIGAGKKDKINKMDIVGMLLQKGQLQKDELGKIEVLDHSAYVAVKSSKIMKVLQLIKDFAKEQVSIKKTYTSEQECAKHCINWIGKANKSNPGISTKKRAALD